jgi:hypothetical protein
MAAVGPSWVVVAETDAGVARAGREVRAEACGILCRLHASDPSSGAGAVLRALASDPDPEVSAAARGGLVEAAQE